MALISEKVEESRSIANI